MTEPAQPQPTDPPLPFEPAPAQGPAPVPASQPVTIEPVDETPAEQTGTTNTTPEQPASPAETQASGTGTQPADDGPVQPGPGGAGASPVVPGAPAEVVDLGGAHIATQLQTGGGTSNESPSLPPNVQAAGAKAHAGLDLLIKTAEDDGEDAETKLPQVVAIAKELRADLDRYVPESIRQAAMADVERMLRKVHL